MRRDTRLSTALHLLLHLSEAKGALTSEALAPLMRSHAVVVRRTLAGLREAGIVGSVKGHGGGWTLAAPLRSVTLAAVHEALGVAPFRIGPRTPKPRCLLEQAADRAVSDALAEAEAHLRTRLSRVTLADVFAAALGRAPQKQKRKAAQHA